jgi:hypothetical protein
MLLNIMVVVALLAGRVYHLDFDPPAATTPGLAERLAVPAETDCDPQQVSLIPGWFCRLLFGAIFT